MTELYKFIFRSDMPLEVRENAMFPELPATKRYLERFVGKEFSLDAFHKETQKDYKRFLYSQSIEPGLFVDIERGISIFKNNAVGLNISSAPGRIEFGFLEKIVQK